MYSVIPSKRQFPQSIVLFTYISMVFVYVYIWIGLFVPEKELLCNSPVDTVTFFSTSPRSLLVKLLFLSQGFTGNQCSRSLHCSGSFSDVWVSRDDFLDCVLHHQSLLDGDEENLRSELRAMDIHSIFLGGSPHPGCYHRLSKAIWNSNRSLDCALLLLSSSFTEPERLP